MPTDSQTGKNLATGYPKRKQKAGIKKQVPVELLVCSLQQPVAGLDWRIPGWHWSFLIAIDCNATPESQIPFMACFVVKLGYFRRRGVFGKDIGFMK
jgi:hypothetical protein